MSFREYPLFSKMRDFYRGTDLPREDLDDLASELRDTATRRGDGVWSMVVTSVLLPVEKAIREDVAIYCRGPRMWGQRHPSARSADDGKTAPPGDMTAALTSGVRSFVVLAGDHAC
jgi:hypothetical protein